MIPHIQLTRIGEIVEKYLLSSENISGVKIDRYVIMPDHIHIFIFLNSNEYLKRKNGSSRAPTPTNEMLPHMEVIDMQKWCIEDWQFELTVIRGKAEHCRLGLEKGDKFVFSYECPAGMCPKTMMAVYTWCEVIRCGGDFTYRGEKERYEINIPCADGCIQFHLKATPINREENGKTLPTSSRQ